MYPQKAKSYYLGMFVNQVVFAAFDQSTLFDLQSVWEEGVVILASRLNGFHFLHLPCSKEIIITIIKSKNQ